MGFYFPTEAGFVSAVSADSAVVKKIDKKEDEIKKFATRVFWAILRTINTKGGASVDTNALILIVKKNFAVDSMLSRVLGAEFRTIKSDREKFTNFTDCFIKQIVELYKSNLEKYKTASFSIEKVEKKSSSPEEYQLTALIKANKESIPVELDICQGAQLQPLISRMVINDIDVTLTQREEANSFGSASEYVDRLCEQYANKKDASEPSKVM
jgi:ABC-type transporter MlaC component